ncbi:MAG: ATP-binding protein [bacterium]
MKIKSFTQKIVIGFLAVLLLMVILASVSYHAFTKMERLSQELNQMLLLDMFLDESMGSHRKWMNDLAQTFLLNRKFQGSLDPHKCEFGKWYHSFQSSDDKIMEIHKKIDKPHHILHESAKQILDLLYEPGRQRDIAHLLDEEKNEHMLWFFTFSRVMEKQEKIPLAFLEMRSCSIDRLYESFSAGDGKGMVYLQPLRKSHQRLHELSQQAIHLAQQGRWKEAKRLYSQDIRLANKDVLDYFFRLDILVHQRIKGNQQAREIYARLTIPAMEELQHLVDQIRSSLMARIGRLENEYQQVAGRSKKFIVWATLFVISLAILCSLLIPPGLTRPIRHLTQFANRIASGGDLSETIRIENQDEIGQLASSFNRMIQALRKSREELEEWGKTLEKKVETRTRDLKDAYRQLEMTQGQLVQSSKLASIGELAAGMAHEINNPMTVIVGYSELLLDEVTPGTENHVYVQGILEAGQRISMIIRNLLTFARQGTQERSRASIPVLIDRALSFMEKRMEKDGIRIERDYEPGLPDIYVRMGQLGQVFLNLIINARDALLEKSETASGDFAKVLKVQVRKVEENDIPAIRITFRDTGAGIKPENLSRVFDPFFTTKREDKGTGLGLSISYGIIKDHQGSIRVESREGEYTMFTIDLPANQISSCSKERGEHERHSLN